jgi:Na+-translocating ferredoxin:NAD+ oxidoreductase RnfE subunit
LIYYFWGLDLTLSNKITTIFEINCGAGFIISFIFLLSIREISANISLVVSIALLLKNDVNEIQTKSKLFNLLRKTTPQGRQGPLVGSGNTK